MNRLRFHLTKRYIITTNMFILDDLMTLESISISLN